MIQKQELFFMIVTIINDKSQSKIRITTEKSRIPLEVLQTGTNLENSNLCQVFYLLLSKWGLYTFETFKKDLHDFLGFNHLVITVIFR